jgi:hypothetical protein
MKHEINYSSMKRIMAEAALWQDEANPTILLSKNNSNFDEAAAMKAFMNHYR